MAAKSPCPTAVNTSMYAACTASMPRTLGQGLFAALVFLALTSCAVDPAPPVRYFRIEIPVPGSVSRFSGRILVEPFEAYGINNERSIVFRSREATSALEQYHYASWAEPPGVTLRDSLIAYLRGAFPQAQILPAGGRTRGDFTLRPRLKRLEHVLGSPAQAAFAAEYRVTDFDDEDVLQVAFDDKAAAAGASVEDFVAALDPLIGKSYGNLADQLRKALEIRSPPPAAKPG